MWLADFQSAQRTYQEYVTLVRITYQHEPDVLRALGIDQPVPENKQKWLERARLFYAHIPAYNALLDQKFGLKLEVWAQALMEIHTLITTYNASMSAQ
ncbi:MAG: hypothetical protein AAGE93_03645 [Bacteroidota bacterium]